MEAPRQHVNEETADELGRGQGHGLVTITPLGAIVLYIAIDPHRYGMSKCELADEYPPNCAHDGDHVEFGVRVY